MYDPGMDEDSILQEIPSSEDSEDEVASSSRSSKASTKPKEIKDLVHVKLSQLHEMISDDDADDTVSPIGSPPADISILGGRDKFLELKRKLEEDQARNRNQQDIQPVQVTDVQTLLDSFKADRDQTRSTISKIEANPRFLELYQQVKDRDHKIIDLEAKFMEQGRQIIDLEDNLMQKEKLLTSKNEAVSVVQRKFEAELLLKQQDLEKAQRVLFEMERNLGKVQDQWKEDKDRLTAEINKQAEKYKKYEESSKEGETIRFELSTELAEVKETVIQLQKQNGSLAEEKAALAAENQKLQDEAVESKSFAEITEAKMNSLGEEQKKLEEERKALLEEKDGLKLEIKSFETERLSFYTEKEQLGRTLEDFDIEKSKFDEIEEQYQKSVKQFQEEKQAFEVERDSFNSEKNKLQESLTEKSVEVDALKETVEKYQSNIKKLKAQFQAKLKTLKEGKGGENTETLQSRVGELEAKIAELENKLTELEEEKGNLLLRLVDFDEHQDFVAVKQKLAAEQEELMRDRLNLEIDAESVKDDRIRLDMDREQLEQERVELNQELDKLNQQRDNLNQERANLYIELNSEKEKLEQERSRFQDEVQENRENLGRERESIAQQLQQIIAEREIIRVERESLTKQLESLLEERKLLSEQQAVIEERETTKLLHEASQTSIPETSFTCDASFNTEPSVGAYIGGGDTSEMNEREAAMTAQIQELTEKLETAQVNVKKLKLQFQAKLKQIRNEQKEKFGDERLVSEIKALENKLAELEEEKGNLLLRLVDYDELQANFEAAKKEMESLQVNMQASELEINTLAEQHLQRQSTEFEEMPPSENVVIQQLVKTLGQSKETVTRKSTEMSEILSQNDEYKGRVELLTQEIAVLEHALTEKTEQVQSLEEQVEFNREDFANAVSDFDASISKKNEEIAKLKEQLENRSAAVTDDTELDSLRQELAEVTEEKNQEILRLTTELAESNRLLNERSSDLSRKVAEFDRVNAEYLKLSSDLDQLVKSVTDSGSTLEFTALHQSLEESNTEGQLSAIVNPLLEQIRSKILAVANQNLLVATLTTEVTELKSQLFETVSALDIVTTEFEELKAQETVRIQNLALMGDTQEYEAEMMSFRNDLLQKTEELENVYQQLDSLKTKLLSAQEEVEAFQLRASDLEVQTNQLESMKIENSELKTQMADKDEELEFTVNELLELRTKLKAIESAAEKTQDSVSIELDNLREETAVKDKKIQDAELQISTLSSQISYLQSSLTEVQSKYEAIESQFAEQQVKVADEINELKKQLLEKDEEVELSVTELCNVRAANRDLLAAQESYGSERNSLLAELESVKQRLSEVNKDIDVLNQERTTLQGQLQEKVNEVAFKDESLIMLEGELQNHKSQLSLKEEVMVSLQSESRDLQDRINQLATEANAANARLAEMAQFANQTEEQERLKAKIGRLEAEVTDKDGELESTVQELLELRSKCNELQVSVNQMCNLQSTIEEMRGQLLEKDEELDFTNNQIMSLSAKSGQVDKVTKALQETQAILAQKTAEHTEQAEVIESLQKQVVSLNFEKSRAENEITELQANMQNLDQSLRSKTEELEFTTEEMMKLRRALDEVERDVFKDIQDKENLMKIQLQELQTAVNEKDEEIKKVMADYDEYYNQARNELDSKIKAIEVLEQNLFEKTETVLRLEQNIQEIIASHQNEIYNLSVTHKAQLDSAEARISQLSQVGQQSVLPQSPVPVQSQSNSFSVFGGSSDPSGFFDNFTVPSPVQEPLIQSAQAAIVESNVVDQANVAIKDKQIYDQEVQITELQITVEELRSQLEEMTNQLSEVNQLKSTLKTLQAENHQLQENVKTAVEERESLQNERTKRLEGFLDMDVISGAKDYTPPPNAQPVQEPPVIKATAYETTDKSVEELSGLIQQKDAQIIALNQELREVKVKSGKVLQKLRQTTNKYEELSKQHQALKTKSEFSLESAFESEFTDQLAKKDAVIQELQAEKQKLQAQMDIFERSNDKLIDHKENQDSVVESLVQQKKQLEYEVSGLKWKIEELENSLNSDSRSRTPADAAAEPGNMSTVDRSAGSAELESLKVQNAALTQEITNLQAEVNYQREVVASLHNQLQQAYYNLQQVPQQEQQAVQGQASATLAHSATPGAEGSLSPPVVNVEGQTVSIPQELIEEERIEREILEQKIELLQNKISELEVNESRYYEDFQKTKIHAQMLDMENLQYQDIIADLNRRLNGTERDSLKTKILQEEVNRLILALDEKDNSKYEEITSEIFKLQEEKAQLEYQLGLLNAKHQIPPDQENLSYAEQDELDDVSYLRLQLSMLERQNLILDIDLRREANARRVVQEQLFFHQAAKSQNHKLGALVGNSLTAYSAKQRASSTSSSPSRHSPLPAYNLFASPGGISPKVPAETAPRTPS